MSKKSDDEYKEAMARAERYRQNRKSAWSPPKQQKNPSERDQYVTKSIFGGEKRTYGRAAGKASRQDKRW